MKTLIIIRHAKAEENFGNDSERKITEEGYRNVRFMANLLLEKGYTIDKIFSSPSVRTRETTEQLASAMHVNPANVKYFEKLYLGDTLAIMESVEWLKENIQTLVIVGHNPGVTNFVNDLTQAGIEALPTCGIAVLTLEMNDWESFEKATKTLVTIFSPKDF